MTPEKAIEVLEHENYLDPNLESPDVIPALALSINALKRHKEDMMLSVWCFPRPLPGETE